MDSGAPASAPAEVSGEELRLPRRGVESANRGRAPSDSCCEPPEEITLLMPWCRRASNGSATALTIAVARWIAGEGIRGGRRGRSAKPGDLRRAGRRLRGVAERGDLALLQLAQRDGRGAPTRSANAAGQSIHRRLAPRALNLLQLSLEFSLSRTCERFERRAPARPTRAYAGARRSSRSSRPMMRCTPACRTAP